MTLMKVLCLEVFESISAMFRSTIVQPDILYLYKYQEKSLFYIRVGGQSLIAVYAFQTYCWVTVSSESYEELTSDCINIYNM